MPRKDTKRAKPDTDGDAQPPPAKHHAATAPAAAPSPPHEPLPAVRAPKAGTAAPDFSADALLNGDFTSIKLSDFKGKYLVLLFYPLDFTFVCPTEIIAFNDRYEEFKALNAEIVGVSVDSKFVHLSWTQTPRNKGGVGSLKFPLIGDVTKKMARDYNVLIDEGEDAGVTLRGLFIISDKGVLRSMTVNDLPVGRSVDETLRTIRAFQYTDKHGEVCPANWTPGAATMKADPEGSKVYFEQQR